MEVAVEQSVESNVTEAPVENKGDGISGGEEKIPSTNAETVVAQPAPQWTPSYKYKFDQEEREIDPFFRGLIKDADSEKRVKEFVERAEALPRYKENYTKASQELNDIKPQFDKLTTSLQDLGNQFKSGDYEGFFKTLNVPDKVLFKYVAQKLQYQDLPEDQRRLYDSERATRERNVNLEREVAASRKAAETETIQARSFQLDQSLAKAEIKQLADAVDKHLGSSGAFRQRVIEIGRLAALDPASPRDLSVDEAVSLAMKGYEPFIRANQTVSQSPGKPAVIPNVGGTHASPAKRGVRSLADIHKRAAELNTEE